MLWLIKENTSPRQCTRRCLIIFPTGRFCWILLRTRKRATLSVAPSWYPLVQRLPRQSLSFIRQFWSVSIIRRPPINDFSGARRLFLCLVIILTKGVSDSEANQAEAQHYNKSLQRGLIAYHLVSKK